MTGEKSRVISVGIAADDTTSDVISIPSWAAFVAIQFPAMVGTTFTFTGCATPDGSFVQLVDEEGTALSHTITDSKIVTLPPDTQTRLMAVPHWKIVSGSTETSAVTIKVFVKG